VSSRPDADPRARQRAPLRTPPRTPASSCPRTPRQPPSLFRLAMCSPSSFHPMIIVSVSSLPVL
jgi:hypothetical protein